MELKLLCEEPEKRTDMSRCNSAELRDEASMAMGRAKSTDTIDFFLASPDRTNEQRETLRTAKNIQKPYAQQPKWANGKFQAYFRWPISRNTIGQTNGPGNLKLTQAGQSCTSGRAGPEQKEDPLLIKKKKKKEDPFRDERTRRWLALLCSSRMVLPGPLKYHFLKNSHKP